MVNLDSRLTATFHALADPQRRRIVARLTRGSASVTELAAGALMSLPGFLKHVRVLESAGLVVTDKNGRTRHCRLAAEALGVAEEWLGVHRRFWEERLDALDRLVGGLTNEEELQWPLPKPKNPDSSTSTARSPRTRSASSPRGPTPRSSRGGSRRRRSTR